MGQYYMPVIKEQGGAMYKLYSHDYGSGIKLMEHSYIGNDFVNRVLFTAADICKEEDFIRLYWVGDYAIDVMDEKREDLIKVCKYAWNEKIPDYKFEIDKDTPVTIGWLVHNLDKHMVLSIPAMPYGFLTINVLPILTNLGNGQGGGDFHGRLKLNDENMTFLHIGEWAGDKLNVIGVHSNDPDEIEMHWACIEHNDPEVQKFYPEIDVSEEY